jgi:NAD(P)H-dependent FMN reductase
MKIQVIVGSTRPGRQSDKLAKWVNKHAQQMDEAEVELIDLRDYDMPLFNEPGSPQFSPDRQPVPAVQKWLDKVGQADGYIFVTPEYNRSAPAVLKNAIDFLDFQIAKKPVALVAHGSTGGAQAVSHLRGILPGALAVTVPKVVYFNHRVGQVVSEDGELSEELRANPAGPEASLKALLEDLVWYAKALSSNK